MSTPGGLVDKQELIDAQLDTAHLGRVVNSKDESGNPIDTSTNRTGGVNKTLDALETEYLEAIQGAGGVSVGTWTAGVTTFNAYNEYAVYNGIPYKPRTSATLPYVAQGADPTTAPDDANVQPYQEITEAQVVAVVEATIPDELPKYTDIVYKASGGNSAVENMISGVPVSVSINQYVTCENGSIFKRITSNGNIDDFLPVSNVNPLDFGYNMNASDMIDETTVSDNWAKMKQFLSAISSNPKSSFKLTSSLTIKEVYANWVSGTKTPLGFYSDSTTDGAKTTGHTPSTFSDAAPFSVTINNSPNAYPQVLQDLSNNSSYAKTLATTYNGGFDGQSYLNGFGLKHWYNTWFRGLSGSNVDWSDVKMIVLGFGVSDAANIDDTASVIQNYSEDLECTIVDCLLRGVQPVLQGPVPTVQHVGNALNGRNGDQVQEIINSVQDKLAKKYNLEVISYSEQFEKALSNFNSINYRDLISDANLDRVHPVDLGHRVHAGSLLKILKETVVSVSNEEVLIFAGSPSYYVHDESLNVDSSVLISAVAQEASDVERISEYFYQFQNVTSGQSLLTTYVYIEKPSILIYCPIENTTENPTIRIFRNTPDNTTNSPIATVDQPVTQLYTEESFAGSLSFGLNRITIESPSNLPNLKVGSLMVVPLDKLPQIKFVRETSGGTLFLQKKFTFEDNTSISYPSYDFKKVDRHWDFYRPSDNSTADISFTLSSDLVAATSYSVFSHFNDHFDLADCFNRFEVTDDDFTVYVTIDGVESQIGTQNIPGLLNELVSGATVKITVRTKEFSSSNTDVSLFVNGVVKAVVSSPNGTVFSTGYGMSTSNMLSRSLSVTAKESVISIGDFSF